MRVVASRRRPRNAARAVATPAAIRAQVEVRLWGDTVGAAVELANGRVLFEYADTFRQRGREISPIHLPLSRMGPIAFDELRRSPAFQGLPGVLADALPDAFGNKVIRAYFAARGETERALSPVQRLLYVGERALGALTFHPATELPMRAAEKQSLAIAALVADARRIVAGEAQVTVPEIYRISASAGGMRPKALVLFDPTTRTLRSANATPAARDVPCILKFDGVGDGATASDLGRPQPFNRVEAAYTKMAQAAGLTTVEITMLEDGAHAHLLVHRFDLDAGERIHQHTLGGLLHVDYNDPGASSYEEYLRTVLRLGMPYLAVEQAFRRMLFNVFAINQDDHVKNLSFHMGRDGRWRLAPAYDLTFAKGQGWTAQHQMRVRDKVSGITAGDLLAIADEFALNRPPKLLAQARDAVARWPEFARAAGVGKATATAIGKELERRAEEVG
jgi:serine/threonine-protein kinase HipA